MSEARALHRCAGGGAGNQCVECHMPWPCDEALLRPTPADILATVRAELSVAQRKFGPMASAHEAVAVIEEEFLEFRSAVFWGVDQKGRPSDPREEAIQLAAMAVRYLLDVR